MSRTRWSDGRNYDTESSITPYSAVVSGKMKVFISWSGEAEREVAEALREAVIAVCAGRAEAFVSSQDIPKGDRGLNVIDAQLKATDYGLVVLSAANQLRPWINYEGGALAMSLDNPVATVLLDLIPSDVEGPLGPLQSTQFSDQADMLRLFTEIAAAADKDLPTNNVAVMFSNVWPTIQAAWTPPDGHEPNEPRRDDSDMLAELVERVRGIEATQAAALAEGSSYTSRMSFTRGGVRTQRPELLKVALREATDDKIVVKRLEKGRPGVLVVELAENEPTSASTRKRAYNAIRRLYETDSVEITLQPLLDPDPATSAQLLA
jgi:hypothetical protein